jgi:tetratricopeptide (TPR) repeat protein
VHNNLAWGYAYTQRYSDAITTFRRELELAREQGDDPTWPISGLGYVYALSGDVSSAQRCLDELLELTRTRYVSAVLIATIYAGLNRTDEAFAWLEKGIKQRDRLMVDVKVDPMYDVIRADVRFTPVVQKVGLPP